MTRPIVFLLASLSLFSLSACSNSEMEQEIQRQMAQKQSLEHKIEVLKVELDSIRQENEKMHKQLSDLDMD